MRGLAPDTRRGIHRRRVLAALAGGLAAPRWALAQAAASWPRQPIKMVIPYPPGGGGDGVGRPLAQGLERKLGVPVVLDYRPGAGGTIAAQTVANEAADGHVLYLADNGALSVAPAHRQTGYGPRDFSYLAGVGELPLVLVANPKVPARDPRELAELSRAKPQGLSYASAGVGSIPHLTAELLKLETRLNAEHIAYKGSGPAITDLISGVVDFAFFAPAGTIPHIASGRLKALAVTSRQRLPALPAVPTVAELGVASFHSAYVSAVLAPKGLPAPVSSRLVAALQAVMAEPDVVRNLEATSLLVAYRAPAQAQEFFERDLERWRGLIQAAKLRLD